MKIFRLAPTILSGLILTASLGGTNALAQTGIPEFDECIANCLQIYGPTQQEARRLCKIACVNGGPPSNPPPGPPGCQVDANGLCPWQ